MVESSSSSSSSSWRVIAFATVCAIVFLLTLVVQARVVRDASALAAPPSPSHEPSHEPFTQGGSSGGGGNDPAYIRAQRAKTLAYARAGLRFFYSDGTLPESTVASHVYLLPTTHDIDCSLGDASRRRLGCAPANSHIATLAAREDRTAVGGAGTNATCAAAFPTASILAKRGDSALRVLEGRYDMTTTCAVVRGRFVATRDRRVVTLVLTRPALQETRAFLLMRPTFLMTATSRLYAVDFTGLDFDSDRTASRTPVSLRLVEVPDTTPQVAPPPSSSSSGSPLITAQETDLRLALYYPSYSGPYPGAQTPTTRQLSLYLTLSPDVISRGTPPSLSGSAGSGLRVTIEGRRTVRVQAGTRRVDVPALPGARVIVTRATNALTVACLTPTRTILRVVGGLPTFDVPRSQVAAVAAALPVFKASPALPYDATCIPHLAHIADALGLLRA